MNTPVGTEFSPTPGSKLLEVAAFVVIICIVFMAILGIGPNWFVELFGLTAILLFALRIATDFSEKIIVTSDEVIRKSLWKNKKIPFSDIESIYRTRATRGTPVLRIKTKQSTYRWGGSLSDAQINEAVECVLIECRYKYPDRYVILQDAFLKAKDAGISPRN